MNLPEMPQLNAKSEPELRGRRVSDLVLYPAWEYAYNRAIAVAQLSPIGTVAFVIGAGGAGKTSMFTALGEDVFGEPSTWSIGQLPIVKVSAENPDHAFFSSKGLMTDLLGEVMDIFRAGPESIEDWKLDEGLKARLRIALTRLRGVRSSEEDLRRAFVSIAKALGVKLILVDEANLMCLTQRNRVPTDYLESLRVLAQRVECRIILFGTIDLLAMVNYSAQLNRRNPKIHIERLHFETKSQKHEFVSFLHDMESELGLAEGLLVANAAAIHEYTYGIAGEVVGLVQRADEERQATDATEILWEHILACAPLPDVLRRMREEADLISLVMSGEYKEDSEDHLRARRHRPRCRRRPRRYQVPQDRGSE